jgi:hypothetical protein
MSNPKYNQFIQTQMKQEQPDKEKLIGIASLIRQSFDLIVHREPILTFDRQTYRFVNFSSWLTEEQFKKYAIHVPDLLFFLNKKMWIFEIDGYIHNVKNNVIKKDEERDLCYNIARLNWRKFNEWEILLEQGIQPKRSATVEEIWPTVKAEIESLI